MILFTLTTAVLGPMMYKGVMRHYVGSKVVMLTKESKLLKPEQGGGTGFHVTSPSGKTYIMTNRHVCSMSKTGKLWASSGDRNTEVSIIAVSNESDLCVVSGVPGEKGLDLGEAPNVGDEIIYVGHPRLQPKTYVSGEVVGTQVISISAGVIGRDISENECKTKDSYVQEVPEIFTLFDSFRRGDATGRDYSGISNHPMFANMKKVRVCFQRNKALVTTLMIYPGASGSPVVNLFGQLVGVVYAGPTTGGWGYAVLITDVKSILIGR